MGNIKILILLTFTFISLNVTAQGNKNKSRLPYDTFNEKWEIYHYRSKGDLGILNRYFRDTVSVEEMKQAFYTNKDKRFPTSPYADYDSIVNGFHDLSILLNSPLRDNPLKKVRNMRGVWARGKRFHLQQLLDENGVPRDDLLKKVNKDTVPFMERTYIFLRAPRHYMGFIVSPLPSADTFDRKLRVGTGGFNYRPLDFFSSAAPNGMLDGDWYNRTKTGARYMGRLLNLYYGNEGYEQDDNRPERTFYVLLYEKPKVHGTLVAEYTIELLLPENPDKETSEVFKYMKYFVEELRYNSFNPLFTSDMRIMTGRYYRVTVNKCGWLVEDYFDINN